MRPHAFLAPAALLLASLSIAPASATHDPVDMANALLNEDFVCPIGTGVEVVPAWATPNHTRGTCLGICPQGSGIGVYGYETGDFWPPAWDGQCRGIDQPTVPPVAFCSEGGWPGVSVDGGACTSADDVSAPDVQPCPSGEVGAVVNGVAYCEEVPEIPVVGATPGICRPEDRNGLGVSVIVSVDGTELGACVAVVPAGEACPNGGVAVFRWDAQDQEWNREPLACLP